MNWISIVYLILVMAATLYASLRYVHMLQLESYQGRMYLKWVSKHFNDDFIPFLLIGVLCMALRSGYVLFYPSDPVLSEIMWYLADAGYLAGLVFIGFVNRKKPAKKPLKFTGRAIRLLMALALIVVPFTFAFFIKYDISTWGGYLLVSIQRYLPGILLPLTLMLAYLITYPIEALVKRWYFNDAHRKLDRHGALIKVAITGSYGKTSTKFILATILSEKYKTLATPGSFNTPMGVTRVIREQLEAEHEAFIAEMGARYSGDIKELCNLVKPRYGIITSLGKQHLETFGSLEGVIATKAELIDGLDPYGAIFLNGDNPYCTALYERETKIEKHLFGLDAQSAYMRASDIQIGNFGSRFTLQSEIGEKVDCTTRLLGRHNILNITAAAALAYRLGLTMEQIASGIAKIKPVEHRLELIPGPITVIDDAFNANPEGAKHALETIKGFPGRRIIVTPGMVELGAEEETLNEAFGRDMASAVDVAILVGKAHVEPIRRGLLEAGFAEENILRVGSLAAASEALPSLTQPGCVVLFENDLTDNYEE